MTNTENKFKKTAWVKAMDYLAMRDHSEKELIEKLMKFFELDEIHSALDEMKARGWLIPPEELSEKVTHQLHKKNKGYLYISQYLHKKGLPPTIKDDEKEFDKALNLARGKSKNLTDIRRVTSLLKNRGFDTETIGKVVHEIRRNSPSLY